MLPGSPTAFGLGGGSESVVLQTACVDGIGHADVRRLQCVNSAFGDDKVLRVDLLVHRDATHVTARYAVFLRKTTRTRSRVDVDHSEREIPSLPFNLVDAARVLDEAEVSALLNGLGKGLGNVWGECMRGRRLVLFAPPFKDPVEFPDVD